MHILNPKQFAAPPPRRVEPVGPVPGLNASDGSPAELSVLEMTAWELGEFQASLRDEWGSLSGKTNRHNTLKYLASTLCDPSGNLLWQDRDEAVTDLGRWPATVTEKLFEAAQKLNSLDEESISRAEGNSGATPNSSGTGTSAPTSEPPTPDC